MAYLLCTAPSTEIRDGERALRLIDEALSSLDTGTASQLLTRAAALAELGRYGEALSAAEKARSAGLPGQQADELRRLFSSNQPLRTPR